MRKVIGWFTIFLLLTGIIVGVCIYIGDKTVKTVSVGEVIDERILSNTLLLDWKAYNGKAFTLSFSEGVKAEKFALTLGEVGAYKVYCNGKLLDAYDGKRGYLRVVILELPLNDESSSCSLMIEMPEYVTRNKIMLSTYALADRYIRLADGANMLTIGMYLLILYYSLTLYLSKRSEHYLLYIVILSVIALVSVFSNSTIALPNVLNIDQPVRYFRVTFCAALCALLMHVRLPGRWRYLYSWRGILLYTAFLYGLNIMGLEDAASELSYLLIAAAGLACASGCTRKVPFAVPFMVFVALREALRIYFRLCTDGVVVCPPFLSYYYLPQVSSVLFILGCMLIINERFGRKFRETNELALKLEEANANLDSKVAQRTTELNQMYEQLVHAQELKHNIMTNIFHDLRTPIFIAQGMAERVVPKDAYSEEKLELLRERLDFLEHMSEQLFFQSKLEEGKVHFEWYRIRVEDFMPPLSAGFESLAVKKGIKLITSYEKSLMFTADSYRLKEALGNLLSNAIKYSGKGEIHFSAKRQEHKIIFSVLDSGTGIAKEDLPFIFDRYYQGKLNRGADSAGLGLCITKAIVEAHNGTLHVESTLGKGSLFTVTLPIERLDDDEIV